MARRQAALFHDLLNTWRFVGAAIWCHGALLAAHMACAVILSPFTHTSPLAMLGWRGLLLHALQMGVLMAHRRTLSASEAAPPQIPKLPFNGSAWIAPLLARLVLRDRKLSSAAASAWLLGATAACAVAYTYLYPSIALQGTTLQWSLVLGISVALTYTLQHLGRWVVICIIGLHACTFASRPSRSRLQWCSLQVSRRAVIPSAATSPLFPTEVTLAARYKQAAQVRTSHVQRGQTMFIQGLTVCRRQCTWQR